MPTNFQISSAPALRCVTGASYDLSASERAAGFFSRLKLAERLLIQSGPQQCVDLAVPAWAGRRAQLDIQSDFPRNSRFVRSSGSWLLHGVATGLRACGSGMSASNSAGRDACRYSEPSVTKVRQEWVEPQLPTGGSEEPNDFSHA